jgi:hypothetical protein
MLDAPGGLLELSPGLQTALFSFAAKIFFTILLPEGAVQRWLQQRRMAISNMS